MANTIITITHDTSTADMERLLEDESGRIMLRRVMNYLNSVAGGAKAATVDLQVSEGDAVAASGTITFSGVGQANDTVLINGVTFTAVASGATGDQWNVGASATASAAALAAAINASATALVSDNVSASADSGVVTITASKKGTLGNCVTIAEGVDGLTHMAVSGARLTGGSDATANSFSFGR